MNKYKFIAINKDAKKIKGIIDASSVDELRKIISYHDYYLLKYKQVKKKEFKLLDKKTDKVLGLNVFKNTANPEYENISRLLNEQYKNFIIICIK